MFLLLALLFLWQQYGWKAWYQVSLCLAFFAIFFLTKANQTEQAYQAAPTQLAKIQMVPDTISVNGDLLSFRGKEAGQTYQVFYILKSEKEQEFFKNLNQTMLLSGQVDLEEATPQRNFIEPALVNTVHTLLAPHGAQQEDEQEQADRKKEHSQHDQQIARTDEPVDPRHDVQCAVVRGKRTFEVGLIDRRDVAAVVQRSGHVLLIIGGSLAGIIVFVQSAGAEQDLAGVFVREFEVDVGGERVIAFAEKIARDRIVLGPCVHRCPAVASRLLQKIVFCHLPHLLAAVRECAVADQIRAAQRRRGEEHRKHDQQRDGRAFDPEFSVELFHCLSPSSL